MTKIQNKNANVENLTLVESVKNKVVQDKTQEIFDDQETGEIKNV